MLGPVSVNVSGCWVIGTLLDPTTSVSVVVNPEVPPGVTTTGCAVNGERLVLALRTLVVVASLELA